MKVAKAELIAGPGAVLACPKCRAIIGTLRKPLYQGWTFGLDAVRFEPGQEPNQRRPAAECRSCGTAYSDQSRSLLKGLQTRIHTTVGWLPPEPEKPPIA